MKQAKFDLIIVFGISVVMAMIIFTISLVFLKKNNAEKKRKLITANEIQKELIDIMSNNQYKHSNLSDLIIYTGSVRIPSFIEYYSNYNPQSLFDFFISKFSERFLQRKNNSIKMFIEIVSEIKKDSNLAEVNTKLNFDVFLDNYEKYCIKKSLPIENLLSQEALNIFASYGFTIVTELNDINTKLLNIKLLKQNHKRIMEDNIDKAEATNLNSMDLFVATNCRLTESVNHSISYDHFIKTYQKFCQKLSLNFYAKTPETLFEHYGITYIKENKKYITTLPGTHNQYVIHLKNIDIFLNDLFDENITKGSNFHKLIYQSNFSQRYFNIIFWNFIGSIIIVLFCKFKFQMLLACIYDFFDIFRMVYYRENSYPFLITYNFQSFANVKYPIALFNIYYFLLIAFLIALIRTFLMLGSFYVNKTHCITKLLVSITIIHDFLLSFVVYCAIFEIVWECCILIASSFYSTIYFISHSLYAMILLMNLIFLIGVYFYLNYSRIKAKKYISVLVSDFFKTLIQNYEAKKEEQKTNLMKIQDFYVRQKNETIKNRTTYYRKKIISLIRYAIPNKQYSDMFISYLFKEPFIDIEMTAVNLINMKNTLPECTSEFVRKLIDIRMTKNLQVNEKLEAIRLDLHKIFWITSENRLSSFESAQTCISLLYMYEEFILASKKNNYEEMSKNMQFISEVLHFLNTNSVQISQIDKVNYFSNQRDHTLADSVFNSQPFHSIISRFQTSYASNNNEFNPIHLLIPFIVDICFTQNVLNSNKIAKTFIQSIIKYFEAIDKKIVTNYPVFEYMFNFKQISTFANKSIERVNELNSPSLIKVIPSLMRIDNEFSIIIEKLGDKGDIKTIYADAKIDRLISLGAIFDSYENLMLHSLFKNHFSNSIDKKYLEFIGGLFLFCKTPCVQNGHHNFIRTEEFKNFKLYIGYGFHTIRGIISLLNNISNLYTEHFIMMILKTNEFPYVVKVTQWINFVLMYDIKEANLYFKENKLPAVKIYKKLQKSSRVDILTLYLLYDKRNKSDEELIRKIVLFLRLKNLQFCHWRKYFKENPKLQPEKNSDIHKFFQILIVYHSILSGNVSVHLKQIFKFFVEKRLVVCKTYDQSKKLKLIVKALHKIRKISQQSNIDLANKLQKSQSQFYLMGLKLKKFKDIVKIVIANEPISQTRFIKYFGFLNLDKSKLEVLLQYVCQNKILHSRYLIIKKSDSMINNKVNPVREKKNVLLQNLVNDLLKLIFKKVI